MTDIVTVETSDHARLALQLAYNWQFNINPATATPEQSEKIFQVPDFVGDATKAIASRVRGAVATSTFDNFHKNSATLIRKAVFGHDDERGEYEPLLFKNNNLIVTNVDIQSVEPVDQRTRDSLQKSVQLAIEITTKSQEASARHDAERVEQEAKGRLERQKINDEAQAEKARTALLELQAHSAAVESSGQAAAEARARAEAANIEGRAAVKQASLKAEASSIRSRVELQQTKLTHEAELKHKQALYELEISRAKEMAAIEADKFKDIVEAIGPSTIKSIATAGPETQAKLLKGLGLKSFLITDGNSPVNLFNTAQGLIGGFNQ
jgi:major vault protein